jgi:hypothetical protein
MRPDSENVVITTRDIKINKTSVSASSHRK